MAKDAAKLAVGLWMIATVLTGYLPQPEYLVELTCISNTAGGLLLLADGAGGILKKRRPGPAPASPCGCRPGTAGSPLAPLYRNVAVAILLVFLVCMGSLTGLYRFNFKGAFFFMHALNPIAFVACYLFWVDEGGRGARALLAAPSMVLLYFLFDWVRARFVGSFVYGFVGPGALSPLNAAAMGLAIYAAAWLLGAGLFALNRLVHRKPGRSDGAVS